VGRFRLADRVGSDGLVIVPALSPTPTTAAFLTAVLGLQAAAVADAVADAAAYEVIAATCDAAVAALF
jgi:hypothetical protein